MTCLASNLIQHGSFEQNKGRLLWQDEILESILLSAFNLSFNVACGFRSAPEVTEPPTMNGFRC
jgi:hypothetical protein